MQRIFLAFVLFLGLILAISSQKSYAALGLPPSPWDTCEQDFWDVIQNRAWEEGQREMVQNQNLIARPDSVLSISCFKDQMQHLAKYADENFPGDPDESEGGLGGIYTDTIVVAFRDALGSGDPYLTGSSSLGMPNPFSGDTIYTRGGQLQHLLEILVLDSMVNGVSALGNVQDAINLLGCTRREYIDDNEYDLGLLGNRLTITGAESSDINLANFSGCARMNQVWNQAKCYNFQNPHTGTAKTTTDHDGFYTFPQYVAKEAVPSDYRKYPNVCRHDSLSVAEAACDVIVHGWLPPQNLNAFIPPPLGSPAIPVPALPWNLDSSAPTIWAGAEANANPAPGAAGAGDVNNHYLGLVNSTACSAITPIRTGMIVFSGTLGRKYHDSVCPAAGCYFIPPSSFGGAGTCGP